MDSEQIGEFNVVRSDSMLRIEWDNRTISKNVFLATAMLVFWFIWTPLTVFLGWLLISGNGPTLFLSIWMIFGCLGVVIVPFVWATRWTVERIEIDDSTYTHSFTALPSWWQTAWRIEEIDEISFGRHSDEEVMDSLTVRSKHRTDIIAQWATSDAKRLLFDTIRDNLETLSSSISIIDRT